MEEPQLLDPQLKHILPPMTRAFIDLATNKTRDRRMLSVIAVTLDAMCKVRGPKVVMRFLDNEARYVQPILETLLTISGHGDSEGLESDSLSTETPQNIAANSENGNWQLRYILLLWLSHLMLTPFDLASVGAVDDSEKFGPMILDVSLPEGLPSIARAVFYKALSYLATPTKEQASASRVLVNMALRPDMRKLGLLDCLIQGIIARLSTAKTTKDDVYATSGILILVHGLISTASSADITRHIPVLFERLTQVFGTNDASGISYGSGVIRKSYIRVQRDVALVYLQINASSEVGVRKIAAQMEEASMLENIIDFLLSALDDHDTQVRLAASKALAVITARLNPEMAQEIVEAVVASLKEDIREAAAGATQHIEFSAVNPLRWHGLTMTLSHMLFRRSASPHQLQHILDALYLSLAFEQRSTSGSSIGLNVRDAANYGLWSLARRYTTTELLAIGNTKTRGEDRSTSSIQATATQLLVAACLDPAGNVRRGSSAALQELIGRHPDMVAEGITLVQVVDYHAVGLRRRAMTEVGFAAASLSPAIYRHAIWTGLLGWRGLQAPDTISRDFGANAIGQLSRTLSHMELQEAVSGLLESLHIMQKREVEWRHGVMQALSCVLEESIGNDDKSAEQTTVPVNEILHDVSQLFESALVVSPKDLSKASMRPDLITVATVRLVGSISACRASESQASTSHGESSQSLISEMLEAFTTCLKTDDEATTKRTPSATSYLSLTLQSVERQTYCKRWMRELDATRMTPRRTGYMLALASIAFVDRCASQGSKIWQDVSKKLLAMFQTTEDIETRVTCLQCSAILFAGPLIDRHRLLSSGSSRSRIDEAWTAAIETGLNDYSINERGDVGSLLRLEAMASLRQLYMPSDLQVHAPSTLPSAFFLCLLRLALERLDKVRLKAAKTLRALVDPKLIEDVSTEAYFRTFMLALLAAPEHPSSAGAGSGSERDDRPLTAFWLGISSSTGVGSDALIQAARAALYDVLCQLPTYSCTAENMLSSMSLHTLLSHLLTVISTSLTDERLLLPLLETVSFVLDSGICSRLTEAATGTTPSTTSNAHVVPPRYKFLTLLSLTQKAHFKSTSIPKLLVCVQIYRGLALLSEPDNLSDTTGTPDQDAVATPYLTSLRRETIKKLVSMLVHPFAKVRIAAAESLYVTVRQEVQEQLKGVDWSGGEVESRKVAGYKLKSLLDAV